MQWTDRQRTAIERDGNNLLVSAAAGSGKTAVLVERVKRLILEQDVGVDELLVVTFTNAAASEMKEKIFKSLTGELILSQDNSERLQHLRRQLTAIGTANISTFHAFAYEVVRRYYHIIGKSPGLSLCDETRQSMMQAESMDELLEKKFEQGDPDFLSFLNRYATVKSDRNVRDMIDSLHRFLQSLPDPDAWTEAQLRRMDRSDFDVDDPIGAHLSKRARRELGWVVAYFERTTEVLLSVCGADGLPALAGLASKNEADAEVFRALKETADSRDVFALRRALEQRPAYAQMRTVAAEKPYYSDELKSQITALRDAAKKRVKNLTDLLDREHAEAVAKEYETMRPDVRTLCELVREFDGIYADKKEKKDLLDFSDIERFALQILDDPDVQKEYRERFRYIFVDEYQDSNGVQEALLQKICRTDNVFMVGDVKQSIYKFRLAEPELFIEKYRSYRSGEKRDSSVVDLNSNFRSKQSIIDAVNDLFSVLMYPESTGMEYDEDAALVKGSPYEGPCDEKPVLYIVGTEDSDFEVDEEIADLKATELEALQAVTLIKEHVGRTIYDDKRGCERPLQFRDMAVLMRAVRGNGEIFYRAFVDAGIPVVFERGEGYFNTVEIQVFINLLRLIDNRKQDIPLLSVLRSPVFGFSADDLAAIRIFASEAGLRSCPYNEAFTLYAESGPGGDLKDRCAGFLSRLSTWRDKVRHCPLGDFLAELMNDTRYQIFVRAIPGGAQRHANLRALIDKAEAFEAQNHGGLQEFIRHAEFLADRKSRADVGQAGLLAEGTDAVRIMTIHKSKGLEFPFVLLAGLGKRLTYTQAAPPAVHHRELGIGFRLVDDRKGTYTDSLAFQMINDRLREEELAESIRVLYVAMTRPMDRLILLATARSADAVLRRADAAIPGDVESAGSYLEMIVPVLRENIDIIAVDKGRLSMARAEERDIREELHLKLERGFDPEVHLQDTPDGMWLHDVFDTCFAADAPQESVKLTVTQMAALAAESIRPGMRLSADGQDEGWEGRSESGPFVLVLPQFMSAKRQLTAAERGTAYHDILERIPLSARYESAEEVAAFVAGLVDRRLLGDEEAAAVNPEKVAAFFRSGIGRRIQAADDVHREAPFVMETEYRGSRRLVQGTIDCYFREGDHWVLVDYKSHAMDRDGWRGAREKLARTYEVQMRLYREALEGITGIPVKEAVLYSITAEDYFSVKFDIS
jgi:ATP-dependent helicase/nuclease subunit A